VIKIDPYIFELYRFKVGAFFETQCIYVCVCIMYNLYIRVYIARRFHAVQSFHGPLSSQYLMNAWCPV